MAVVWGGCGWWWFRGRGLGFGAGCVWGGGRAVVVFWGFCVGGLLLGGGLVGLLCGGLSLFHSGVVLATVVGRVVFYEARANQEPEGVDMSANSERAILERSGRFRTRSSGGFGVG